MSTPVHLRASDAPRSPDAHGVEWKAWMVRMGGQPRRTCRDATTNAAARQILREKREKRSGYVRCRCSCGSYTIALPKLAQLEHEGRACGRCRGRFAPETPAVALASILWRAANGYYLPAEVASERVVALALHLRGAPPKTIVEVAAQCYRRQEMPT